ncbi:unnamed protein product [Gongylonema pulchrum]|uniref:GST C-terminal domain-containing protein n=1 Tax=Gongylonema pulchrum TaxID=637853 RepID=A0A183ELU2_9BILA|nr:unnamed protein product [Gongylonema pulchrum]
MNIPGQEIEWGRGPEIFHVLTYALLEASRTELFDQLKNLNGLLLTKTFLVGERMSLADISVAMDLLPAYQYVLDEKARTPLVNLNRWFKTIINQPAVKEVLGELQFASEVAKFDSKSISCYAFSCIYAMQKRILTRGCLCVCVCMCVCVCVCVCMPV